MTKMFDWNKLEREWVREGVERCGFRGENVILVMNWIAPHIKVNPHKHTFEQIAICIQGQFNYHVGHDVHVMTPGCMLRVPAGVMHYVEPIGEETALNLDVFAPIRDDYEHLVDYQAAEFASVPKT